MKEAVVVEQAKVEIILCQCLPRGVKSSIGLIVVDIWDSTHYDIIPFVSWASLAL